MDTKLGSPGPRFTKARKFVKQFGMTSSTIYDQFTETCDLRPKRNNTCTPTIWTRAKQSKIYNFKNAKKKIYIFQQL